MPRSSELARRRDLASLCLAALTACLVFAAPQRSLACDTALIVIDVQNLWLEQGDWRTVAGVHIIEAVAETLRVAREASLTIIYVRDTSVDAAYAGEERLAFPDSIAPFPEDPVFEKKDRDAFTNAALKPTIEGLGLRRLLLCGMASDSCLAATLTGAMDNGFEVLVVADAHSSGHGGRKAAFMNGIWGGWGVSLPTTAELALSLGTSASVDDP